MDIVSTFTLQHFHVCLTYLFGIATSRLSRFYLATLIEFSSGGKDFDDLYREEGLDIVS
jgi:hypothetical protein